MEEYSFITEIDGETYLQPENYEDRFVDLEMVFELYSDPEMGADDVAGMVGVEESDIRNAVFYWTEEPEVYEELVEEADLGPDAEIFKSENELREEEKSFSEESISDMAERSLGDDGEIGPVKYSGPLGDLQEVVEQDVKDRGFKVRYDPEQEQLYRGGLEIHVLPELSSEEEFYFGVDSEGLFLGSTVSNVDKKVEEVDEFVEEIVKQELNTLALENN